MNYINELNGKYFSRFTERELNTLVSVLSDRLGCLWNQFSNEIPNELNKDTVDGIYDDLMKSTLYNDRGFIIGNETSNPKKEFFKSLDKKDVTSFLLKYGKLSREIVITRRVVGEQNLRVQLPKNIDVNDYEESNGYENKTEEYIYEEILSKDDTYSCPGERGELGWTDLDEFNLDEYNHRTEVRVILELPKVDFYDFDESLLKIKWGS